MLPSLSTATPPGALRLAAVAAPPSPQALVADAQGVLCTPAMVAIFPAAIVTPATLTEPDAFVLTARMTLLPVSAIYSTPALSTAMLKRLLQLLQSPLNCAAVAGPLSPEYPGLL